MAGGSLSKSGEQDIANIAKILIMTSLNLSGGSLGVPRRSLCNQAAGRMRIRRLAAAHHAHAELLALEVGRRPHGVGDREIARLAAVAIVIPIDRFGEQVGDATLRGAE